jgi:hypothetical protein
MRHNEDNETVYEDEGIAEFADLIDLQPIDYVLGGHDNASLTINNGGLSHIHWQGREEDELF